MPRYINPDHTFNCSAILRAAWAIARQAVRGAAVFFNRHTTLRQELPAALKEVWADARQERGLAIWAAEQMANAGAEQARRDALPVRDRQIEDARTALMFAEHNDTNRGHILVREARDRLSQLQHAA